MALGPLAGLMVGGGMLDAAGGAAVAMSQKIQFWNLVMKANSAAEQITAK